jgi:hypothetical protein
MIALGTARRQPWNLANFIVVSELRLVLDLESELELAKCSVAFKIYYSLLPSCASCGVVMVT